jgi:hypothetical protein
MQGNQNPLQGRIKSNIIERYKNNVLYGRLNLQFQSQSSWNVSDYKHMKYWMKSNRNLIVQLRLRSRLMLMWQAVRNDATTYRAYKKVKIMFVFDSNSSTVMSHFFDHSLNRFRKGNDRLQIRNAQAISYAIFTKSSLN